MDGRCKRYEAWKRAFGVLILTAILLITSHKACALSVPSSITVDFVFDKPKSTTPYYSESTSFTIENNENKTVNYAISWSTPNGISVTVSPSSGTLAPYESETISVDVDVSSDLDEGSYYVDLIVSGDGTHYVQLIINIKHKVKLEVEDTSLDFGEVDVSDSKSVELTIKEVLGYKDATVTITKVKGNDWISYPSSVTVYAGSSKTITFSLSSYKPGWEDLYDSKGRCSWEFKISCDEYSYTIKVYAEIKLPAKLSIYAPTKYVTIKFDKPKKDNPTYRRTIRIWVRNLGYYSMEIRSITKSGFSGLDISISKPDSVRGYSEELVKVDIHAPSTLSEGTYSGKIYIDAGSAGKASVEIKVKIIHCVKLVVSQEKINFGDVEIMKPFTKTIWLGEELGYKNIENVRIVKVSGNDWITVSPSSLAGIPAGKSVTVDFILKPRGEAVPGEIYMWTYEVRSSNANTVKITLKARVILTDLTKKLKDLKFKLSGYNIPHSYANAVDTFINAYTYAEKVGGEDYRNTWLIASKMIYVLENVETYLSNPDEKASCLVLAGLNLRNIEEDISKISNSELRNDVSSAYTYLKSFFEELARIEAKKYFEKGKENEDRNYLISALSYRISSSIYSTIDQKRAEDVHKLAEKMSKKFDEMVSKANDRRVKAMSLIDDARKLMQKIGNDYYLLNPLNYDDVSKMYASAMGLYEDAISDYKVAGELVLKDYASKELKIIEEEWESIKLRFFAYLAFLIIVFVLITYRVVKGTLNYISDVKELRGGNVVNP